MARSRIARTLLWLYPRAWRERYQEEVLALVEAVGLSIATGFDLARSAVVEHLRGWSGAVFTYLRQTSFERMTDRSGLARFGPLPTGILAAAVALPLQVLSIVIGGVLAERWPTYSSALWVSASVWICILGLVRLAVLRSRQTPLVVESRDPYDRPRLNRVTALFWKVDYPYRRPGAYAPRHSLMRPLEGLAWIGLAILSRTLIGWISAVEHPSAFTTWQLSFNAGLFIVVMATAVARGRRFGLASLR